MPYEFHFLTQSTNYSEMRHSLLQSNNEAIERAKQKSLQAQAVLDDISLVSL